MLSNEMYQGVWKYQKKEKQDKEMKGSVLCTVVQLELEKKKMNKEVQTSIYWWEVWREQIRTEN